VGSRVREDTVVANPYEEGLRLTEERPRRARDAEPARCDLAAGPCAQPLPGGGDVTVELAPRPLRTMAELRVRAAVRDAGGAPGSGEVVVAFSMVGMDMGRNELRLAPGEDGASSGVAVLVRCPSGRKDWIAEVRVAGGGGAPRAVRFPFTVGE
jgi:hypothetical protein